MKIKNLRLKAVGSTTEMFAMTEGAQKTIDYYLGSGERQSKMDRIQGNNKDETRYIVCVRHLAMHSGLKAGSQILYVIYMLGCNLKVKENIKLLNDYKKELEFGTGFE